MLIFGILGRNGGWEILNLIGEIGFGSRIWRFSQIRLDEGFILLIGKFPSLGLMGGWWKGCSKETILDRVKGQNWLERFGPGRKFYWGKFPKVSEIWKRGQLEGFWVNRGGFLLGTLGRELIFGINLGAFKNL